METSVITIGTATIVTVAGKIHIPAAKKLQTLLQQLISSKKYHIIIDCKGMETLSTEGIRALVAGLRATQKWGGELVLSSLSSHALEVLKVSGFLELFNVFPDKSTALNYFSSPFI